MNKVVIDTNILVYVYDKSSSFYDSSKDILENPNSQLFITTKNISELYAVLSKMNVSYNKILNHYKEVRRNTTLLYPNENSITLFQSLLKKYKPMGTKVYDLEIVSIMLANNINEIETFNFKDFEKFSEVTILTIKKS